MSTDARAERRRMERSRQRDHRQLHDDDEVGVQPGWFATLDDLEEAKKASHDMLIAAMGDQRTGGVSWRWWTGEQATEALGTLTATSPWTDHEADILRRIGAHLREYGGFLILATAPGRRAVR